MTHSAWVMMAPGPLLPSQQGDGSPITSHAASPRTRGARLYVWVISRLLFRLYPPLH